MTIQVSLIQDVITFLLQKAGLVHTTGSIVQKMHVLSLYLPLENKYTKNNGEIVMSSSK